MLSVDFVELYMNYDFDKILFSKNNDVINSYKYYTGVKKNYMDRTTSRFKEYSELSKKYDELVKQNNKFENGVVYFIYVDKAEVTSLKKKIKQILYEQKRDFKNFLNYVETISKCKNMVCE